MTAQIPQRLAAPALDCVSYFNQMLDPQFHFVMELGGRLNADHLRGAIRLAMDAEPVLGCRFVPTGRRPYWLRREDLDKLELCEVIESFDVQKEVARFAARPSDAARDPLVQTCILRGKTDTLCLKVNHTAADGAGAKELLRLIASLYRSLENPETRTGMRIVPNLRDRSLRPLLRQAGPTGVWQSLRRKGRKPAPGQWSFPAGKAVKNNELRLAVRRLGPEEFNLLKANTKRLGVTLNDFFLAAFFRSLWELLDVPAGSPQTILAPMNTRSYLPAGQTGVICNFYIALFVTLERVPGEPIEKTAQRVKEAILQGADRERHAIRSAFLLSWGHRLLLHKMRKWNEELHRKRVLEGRSAVHFTNNGALDPEYIDFGLPVLDAWQTHPAAFRASRIFWGSFFPEEVDVQPKLPEPSRERRGCRKTAGWLHRTVTGEGNEIFHHGRGNDSRW